MAKKKKEETPEVSDEIKEALSEETEEKEKEIKKKDHIRWVTYGILIFCVFLFVIYVSSDRHTPYTDQARIKGLAIPIAPRVSGNVTKINVKLHTEVQIGDTLFQLDKRPFELAIKTAEARLDNTAQQIGAKTDCVVWDKLHPKWGAAITFILSQRAV